MAATISANSAGGGGLVTSGDASGVLALQTVGVTALSISAAQVATFVNPPVMSATGLTGDIAAARITTALNASGSAPVYACRAWVNFNGSGTVAIRASGNVSSITDNGTGNYTVNFTTAMPDVNYAATAINDLTSNGAWYVNPYIYAYNTTSVQYLNASSYNGNLNPADCVLISITVFR